MKAIIVNTCDAWKSYDSMRLVGVFTNKKKLKSTIKYLIDSDACEYDDGYGPFKELTVEEMVQYNPIDYLYIEEVELNENIL